MDGHFLLHFPGFAQRPLYYKCLILSTSPSPVAATIPIPSLIVLHDTCDLLVYYFIFTYLFIYLLITASYHSPQPLGGLGFVFTARIYHSVESIVGTQQIFVE